MIRYLGLCLRYVLLLSLCGLTASFVLSNDQALALRLFPLPYEIIVPVYALSAGALFGGFLIGAIVGGIGQTGKLLRLRQEMRKISQQLHALQQEKMAMEMERLAKAHYANASPTLPNDSLLMHSAQG